MAWFDSGRDQHIFQFTRCGFGLKEMVIKFMHIRTKFDLQNSLNCISFVFSS